MFRDVSDEEEAEFCGELEHLPRKVPCGWQPGSKRTKAVNAMRDAQEATLRYVLDPPSAFEPPRPPLTAEERAKVTKLREMVRKWQDG